MCKIGEIPRGKARLPIIHFQGQTVSFREGVDMCTRQGTSPQKVGCVSYFSFSSDKVNIYIYIIFIWFIMACHPTNRLASLKLTSKASEKNDAWKTFLTFWDTIFSGEHMFVGFREGPTTWPLDLFF